MALTSEEIDARIREIISDLRALLVERGLTQREMAVLMNTSQGNIANFLAGKSIPKIDTIIRWCDALDAEFISLPFKRKKA